jgi:hypothetical protein
MIVNNLAGLAGAGISLQDAARVSIVNNTIARNDSSGTAGLALGPGFVRSAQQPSGVVSRGHTPAFLAVMTAAGGASFSDPQLVNNIIYQNRSMYFDINLNGGLAGLGPDPATPDFRDLAVLGASVAGAKLSPQNCLLTSLTGWDSISYAGSGNIEGDPLFLSPYYNGADSQIVTGNPTSPGVTIAVDEGGNPIDLSFGPLTLVGDYHIGGGSPARDSGTNTVLGIPWLAKDYDAQTRPAGANPEMGADEL